MFVFSPCPQLVITSASAVLDTDKIVPVARAASVQELLARARVWVIEESRELAPTRPSLRSLVTQPPHISASDPVTRGLAVTQCHEIVTVTPTPSECELSASSRGRLIIPSLHA